MIVYLDYEPITLQEGAVGAQFPETSHVRIASPISVNPTSHV